MYKFFTALIAMVAFSASAFAADYVVGDMKDTEGNIEQGTAIKKDDYSVGFFPAPTEEENKEEGLKLDGLDINVHHFNDNQGNPFIQKVSP